MTMFFNTLKLAVRSTLANKMRSFLTMLGIIIGVVSVVMLMSIAESTTSSITDAISSMGSDLLTVMVTDDDVKLKSDDYMELTQYDAIKGVAPYLAVNGTARSGSEYVSASGIGVTAEYQEIADIALQAGRGIQPTDLEWRTNVAVIGTEIAEELFESYDVIGKTFQMSNRTFTAVGLLEESGTDFTGSLDARVLIPLTTAQRISDSASVSTCYVQAASSNDVALAQSMTEAFLYAKTGDEDAYSVLNMSALLDTLDSVMSKVSLMLGGIAAISLLVGGIGIMNIMLVSVAERTREIGIRKAIGARRADIMSQFLIEACTLSILGGLIGLGVSALGLRAFGLIANLNVRLEWSAAVGALLFCVLIGVIFGSYPASKASRMTPIDALQRR
ncbi:efflux ABC transporter permease protein [Clostridium sp. CAG:1024]|nr:efflux ABC transporter permease protein [Clostridium sp. CAG:1024]